MDVSNKDLRLALDLLYNLATSSVADLKEINGIKGVSMKNILATISGTIFMTVATASSTFAVDFNSIIVENSTAQSELHFKIKETVKDSKIAAELFAGSKKYIADQKETIHLNTPKEFLTFAKEKKQFKASAKQSEKRLAQELKDLE